LLLELYYTNTKAGVLFVAVASCLCFAILMHNDSLKYWPFSLLMG